MAESGVPGKGASLGGKIQRSVLEMSQRKLPQPLV